MRHGRRRDGDASRTVRAAPYPRSAVEAGAVSADALVSITGHGEADADASLFGGRVLRLRFDDVPCPRHQDRSGRTWLGPADADLASALAFARTVPAGPDGGVSVAVHCLMGKSRSAGVALAILADAFGPGRERDAVAMLLSPGNGSPERPAPRETLSVNPGLVRMADRLLGRGRAVEAALEEALPRFVSWRAYWVSRGCLS